MIPIILFIINADFPICTAASYQQYPSVSYANNQFYVFWVDNRISNQMGLYGARVSRTGSVLDPDGRPLFVDSASYNCDAAYDGANFFVITRNHC